MLFDVELHCDKWKGCKTKWCNGDGGFWCNEDCKLLQVRPITRKRKVEKILSNSDAVYVLYPMELGGRRRNEGRIIHKT